LHGASDQLFMSQNDGASQPSQTSSQEVGGSQSQSSQQDGVAVESLPTGSSLGRSFSGATLTALEGLGGTKCSVVSSVCLTMHLCLLLSVSITGG
jgi:hypothetical protein